LAQIHRPKNNPRNADSSSLYRKIFLVDYLEKGETIMASFQKESSSRQCCPHNMKIMHQTLADLHFEALKHPASSFDLAPSHYYLFHNLNKHIKGREF
jgi:hypothetical protein